MPCGEGTKRVKIRKKSPKPQQSGPPLYLVGYTVAPPTVPHLQSWFDLEYGGPLKIEAAQTRQTQGDKPGSTLCRVTHGPWHALMRLACEEAEAQHWRQTLEWRHAQTATVSPTTAGARDACDQILLAARLARGLTLLTGGTTFDTRTHEFMNPSDWTDRRLERFALADHVMLRHDDTADNTRDWFFTQGLGKFGLEDIEVFRPRGLSTQPVIEQLGDVADELVRLGRIPKVGGTVSLPLLGLSVRALRHRTSTYAGAPLILREIDWE